MASLRWLQLSLGTWLALVTHGSLPVCRWLQGGNCCTAGTCRPLGYAAQRQQIGYLNAALQILACHQSALAAARSWPRTQGQVLMLHIGGQQMPWHHLPHRLGLCSRPSAASHLMPATLKARLVTGGHHLQHSRRCAPDAALPSTQDQHTPWHLFMLP